MVLNLIGRDPFLHGMGHCTYITCQPPSVCLFGKIVFYIFLERFFIKGKVNFEVHWILSFSNPRTNVWLIVRLIFLSFWLIFSIFSTTLRIQFELFHPSIVSIFQCMCTYPINPMGIHLLCCVHGNKHIKTHDVVHNTFANIVWDVGFHVGWKQLHVLFSNTFNSSYW